MFEGNLTEKKVEQVDLTNENAEEAESSSEEEESSEEESDSSEEEESESSSNIYFFLQLVADSLGKIKCELFFSPKIINHLFDFQFWTQNAFD